MRRKAFTMIELIVVIVVIAILAASAIPRFKRDTRVEAINHMLTMIRYTQNLALHDNKHDSNNTAWQTSFWRFNLNNCSNKSGIYYQIGTDTNYNGAIANEESAIDPSNGKFTTWFGAKPCPDIESIDDNSISPNIFINQKYGIKKVTFNGCRICVDQNCNRTSSAKHIGFDNFGRPIKSYLGNIEPNYNGHVVGDCKIKFEFIDDSIAPFRIIIPKETGFAYLEENPNL
jgi:prepilin-type N-terminal cleavage/methylation domain-containing protein